MANTMPKPKKMTDDQVLEYLRERAAQPMAPLRIWAERYGVSVALLCQIGKGKASRKTKIKLEEAS